MGADHRGHGSCDLFRREDSGGLDRDMAKQQAFRKTRVVGFVSANGNTLSTVYCSIWGVGRLQKIPVEGVNIRLWIGDFGLRNSNLKLGIRWKG